MPQNPLQTFHRIEKIGIASLAGLIMLNATLAVLELL